MSRSKKIAFVILFFIAIAILFVLFLIALLSQPSPQAPSPTASLKPTPTESVVQKSALEITRVSPELSQNNLVRIDYPIIIVFNKPINPETFSYELTPSATVATELDVTATTFKIRGDPFWPDEQAFTLIIKSQTRAQDGGKLKDEYTIHFKTGIPQEI